MRLLLDTHVLLWCLGDPSKIPPLVSRAVLAPENDVLVSAVSAFEIAIKQSLGKLDLPGPAESWLPGAVADNGYDWLDLTHEDALRVRALPWHHRDPFDRLLVAQAMGGCTLVSADPGLGAYAIELLWE